MYSFHPLAVDSIRLIKIEPDLSHGHIACTLSQYDGQVPPYDALSYYWGDPTPTRKIYVNESVVDIHEALWEFLDQMQQSQRTGKWIWTDFLCLNQENLEEMGQQIPRMAHIYSEAMRTISWLGCGRSSWASRPGGSSTTSPHIEGDLRRIREKVSDKRIPVERFFAQPKVSSWTYVTERRLKHYTPDVPWQSAREPSPTEQSVYLPKASKEVIQLGQGHMTSPILNVLSLPYWTRVWIAQEVALAKEVTLMFGNVSLDFEDFFLAYKSYSYFWFQHWTSSKERRILRVPMEARAAVNENHASFYQIVRWGLDCNASKPVDRIYGLLGLLARCAGGIRALPSTLIGTIDYERDVRELYWDMAFTSLISIGSFTAEEDEIEGIEHWVNVLPTLGRVLTCPFTPESLQNAVDKFETPLFREKARLALSVVGLCRQANERGDWMERMGSDVSWPTKRYAHRLLSDPSEHLREQTSPFQRLLGSLCLETTNIPFMDENDEYQAVLIGLRLSKLQQRGGMWSCDSHQSIPDSTWTSPGHEVDVVFQCEFSTASSQLPCSTGTWPRQDAHLCKTQDRYLVIPGTTWRLKLSALDHWYPLGEHINNRQVRWSGILEVEIAVSTVVQSN